MTGTPRPEPMLTKQERIAELARNCPDMSFTNLAHHIDIIWLRKAYALFSRWLSLKPRNRRLPNRRFADWRTQPRKYLQ